MTKKYLALIYFLSAFSIPAAYSQENPDELPHLTAKMVNQDGLLIISEAQNWKYHPGDDLRWADPEFDDSGWHSIAPGNLSADAMPDSLWDGYGWWRLTFTADSSFYSQLTHLYFYRWGAAEIYLDGQKIHSFGQFSILADQEVNFSKSLEYHPAPEIYILPKEKHVLAVRYSHHQAKRHHQLLKQNAENLGFSFGFSVEDRKDVTEKRYKYYIVVAAVSAAILFLLALLHMILFVKFPKDSSNLVISSTVFLFFISTTSGFSPHFIDINDFWFTITRFAWGYPSIIASFLLPFVVALVFRLKTYYWSKHLVWLSVLVIIPIHYQVEQSMILVLIAYLFIISMISFLMYRAIRKKRNGVFYVISGAAGTMIFATIWVLDQLNIISLSLELFSIIILALYVSFPIGLSLYITNRYGELFGEMENEVSDRTRKLQEKSAELEEKLQQEKIEASLGRVRSRAFAMKKSDELTEVAQIVFDEFMVLGFKPLRCFITIANKERTAARVWLALPSTEHVSFTIYADENKIIKERFKRMHSVGSFNEDIFRGSEAKEYRTLLFKKLGYNKIPEEHKKAYNLTQLVQSGVTFKDGALEVLTYDKLESHEKRLLQQFSESFGIAYQRFQDIEQAEERAKEVSRQAAADRIRAEISSMRNIRDLQIITPLIWKELHVLGVPFSRCGTFIIDEEAETVQMHLSNPDGKALAATTLTFSDMDYIGEALQHWRNGTIFTVQWNAERLANWALMLAERGLIDSTDTYLNSATPIESLHLHFVPFKQGMLYVGSSEPLGSDELKNIEELAEAFSVAYARYEDFTQLEEKNNELLTALQNLEAAQDQLVQQEKLASLGQLTAGIAHEIKNPLNFVNNFSEVSLELVEEAREEVKSEKAKVKSAPSDSAPHLSHAAERSDSRVSEKSPFPKGFPSGEGGAGVPNTFGTEVGDDTISAQDQYPALILEILDDIEANLRKIHEHGSRADGIVKSMLQHSRGGDGKMEPTDLNALAKEYVNLSFHGMRAGKDPIDVDIQLDLDESVGEVPLVAEDFSRVILNLCNNAFDAMRERLNSNDQAPNSKRYNPKLMVRTHQSENGTITIEIEDNGPGIPDEIKDKILQPFFTTKKGTQGTGLGLSINNDIVKAHGGSLDIQSEPGGTVFIIQINN